MNYYTTSLLHIISPKSLWISISCLYFNTYQIQIFFKGSSLHIFWFILASKSYKLYDLNDQSTFGSHNVVFHKHICTFSSMSQNINNLSTHSLFLIVLPQIVLDFFDPISLPSSSHIFDMNHTYSTSLPSTSCQRSFKAHRPPDYLQDCHLLKHTVPLVLNLVSNILPLFSLILNYSHHIMSMLYPFHQLWT